MLKTTFLTKRKNTVIQTNQINITLNKTQITNIMQEVLTSEDNAALLRAIAPSLQGQFEQFPEFTGITIDSVNEDGSANVVLRIPRSKAEPTTPLTEETEAPVETEEEEAVPVS